MEIKRFLAALTAAGLGTLAAGCGNEVPKNPEVVTTTAGEETVSEPEESLTDSVIVTTISTSEEEPQEELPDDTDETKIKAAGLKYLEFSKKYDAEAGTLSENVQVENTRDGYHGEGYVTGISKEKDWSLAFDVPEEQYYNITLIASSETAVTNGAALNGVRVSGFTTAGEGAFESFTFRNLRLPAGENILTIVPGDGGLELDMIQVEASDQILTLDLSLDQPELSDPAASSEARALYDYICEGFGRRVLIGQHDTPGSTYETDLMTTAAGRAPAIRCGDLASASGGSEAEDKELEAALEWAENGGIVGYMWSWSAPGGDGKSEGVYADGTDFDLTKAVTKESVGLLSPGDLDKLYEDGSISKECIEVISDIDEAAEKLKKLDEAGVAVLWRPLQEASNGYYWWGRDPEAYKWLWTTMYQRMTNYHGLHGLIWVWSAQNSGWYVGDGYCDILSADVYSEEKNDDPQINTLLYLRSICVSKPIAMSECGGYPSIQAIADEGAFWAYIARWGGSYSVTEDGKLSEKYNTLDELRLMYSNDLTVVRDELPDLKLRAEDIAREDEEKQKEAEKKMEDEGSKKTTTAPEEKSEKSDTKKSSATTTAKKSG